MTEIIIDCEELLTREVKKGGNSGYIYLPKAWIGRKVKAVLQPDKKA